MAVVAAGRLPGVARGVSTMPEPLLMVPEWEKVGILEKYIFLFLPFVPGFPLGGKKRNHGKNSNNGNAGNTILLSGCPAGMVRSMVPGSLLSLPYYRHPRTCVVQLKVRNVGRWSSGQEGKVR